MDTNQSKERWSSAALEFLAKIEAKQLRVGIVGLGYVGLPLALCFAENGYSVLGFDTDPAKIAALERGECYIKHIGPERVRKALDSGLLCATTKYDDAKHADALLLCVPTPLGKHLEPDMSYIESTMDTLAPHLRAGQLLCLESTTYPGTTNELLRPRVEERGLTIGRDFFLAFSPEREDPGNPTFSTSTIPKLVGGATASCREVACTLYSRAIANVVGVESPEVAEMAKLFENTFRSVNIGLVNELKLICEGLGIDVWSVIDAASSKPFGFMRFNPGPGLGGHCIPIDPFYLTWKAKEVGIHTHFIELAGEINSKMPDHVVERAVNALDRRGKAASRSSFLVLGAAYKKDIDDLRESPALEIIELLLGRGANVDYSDPHIPEIPKTRKYDLKMRSKSLSQEMLKGYDCVILVTDHSAFDYPMIAKHAQLIVDSRGCFRHGGENVVSA